MAERITVSLRDETANELERYIADLYYQARAEPGATVSRSRVVDSLIVEALEARRERRQEVASAG